MRGADTLRPEWHGATPCTGQTGLMSLLYHLNIRILSLISSQLHVNLMFIDSLQCWHQDVPRNSAHMPIDDDSSPQLRKSRLQRLEYALSAGRM
jgi:hypothetical protein